MLVYLALARFRKRPCLSLLPLALQRDMKAFFGTYTRACAEADELLFKAGDAAAIDEACKRSTVGKLLPDDLYVHRDALDSLEPLLRIYEGCGRAYLGEVEGANVVKIHRRSGKLSYLVYPGFRERPAPGTAALREVEPADPADRVLRLRPERQPARCCIERKRSSRPDDPRREKFARLTAQEEKHGLLENTSGIGTRDGWARRLAERGFNLKGHRLVKANGKPEPQGEKNGS